MLIVPEEEEDLIIFFLFFLIEFIKTQRLTETEVDEEHRHRISEDVNGGGERNSSMAAQDRVQRRGWR